LATLRTTDSGTSRFIHRWIIQRRWVTERAVTVVRSIGRGAANDGGTRASRIGTGPVEMELPCLLCFTSLCAPDDVFAVSQHDAPIATLFI
jgi:hypothetical protein